MVSIKYDSCENNINNCEVIYKSNDNLGLAFMSNILNITKLNINLRPPLKGQCRYFDQGVQR